MQHWDLARYRAWKRDLVVEALRQAGLDAPVAELIDAHGEGRRRAVFHARRGTHEVLEVGFSAARAHRLVAIDRCPVLAKSLDGAIDAGYSPDAATVQQMPGRNAYLDGLLGEAARPGKSRGAARNRRRCRVAARTWPASHI